jgi:hypothetical protein
MEKGFLLPSSRGVKGLNNLLALQSRKSFLLDITLGILLNILWLHFGGVWNSIGEKGTGPQKLGSDACEHEPAPATQ